MELLEWMVRSELKRIRLSYDFEETLIIPQVDSRIIKLPGLEDIAVEKGKAIRVYRGIASQLADLGLAKISEEPLTPKDITAMRWLESSEEGLIKLPDHFYIRAVRLMHDKVGKPVEIQNDLQEILDIRLRKLFKLVFLKEAPTNLLEKLQPEEVFLYNLLREVLNTWCRKVVYIDGE
jgi:hypothetical protein